MDNGTHPETSPAQRIPHYGPTWVARRPVLVTAVFACALGLILGWAATVAFAPPSEVAQPVEFSGVVVTQGEVGSSVHLSVIASWPSAAIATNSAEGVVTSVDLEPGSLVDLNQELYSVDLRPVVAGIGTIPSFTSIAPGATGDHVVQLQEFLIELGYWQGEATGTYSWEFASAVKAWQSASGFPADGVVQAGDVVWFPTLPIQASLESEVIAPGQRVVWGSGAITAIAVEPRFVLPASPAQAQLAPIGTTVLVESPAGQVWDATVASHHTDPTFSESVEISLSAPDGGAICGNDCAAIPTDGETNLMSEVITIPAAQGLVVPASAIGTTPNGRLFVVSESGEKHEIEVKQSARGMVLIDGVDEGLVVRIPNEENQ